MAGEQQSPLEALNPLFSGLPPVLPSLSKPAAPASSPTPIASPTMGAGMPATALPPVTTPSPTPEQQRVSAIRTQLDQAQSKPSFTAGLWQKASAYHQANPGVIGRLGQVGAGLLRGVDIAGETLAPNIARNIPGTGRNRWANIQQLKGDLAGAEASAKTAAETDKDQAEAAKARAEAAKATQGQPRKYGVVTGAEDKNGAPVVYEEEGPEAGTAQALTGFDVKPDKTSPQMVPLSQADADRLNSTVNGGIAAANKKLPRDKQMPLNPYSVGMTQEQAKFTEETLNQMIGKEQGQVHVAISEQGLADKEQKAAEAAAQSVTQGRMNLYAQQNYAVEMRRWLDKVSGPQYAKDVTLMTNLIQGEQEGHGVMGGVLGSTPIGVLLGSVGGVAGAATGAGIGVLANAISGPAASVLDSLKKQGLSPEGYQAMQAYFNALPARMAFEIGSQGLKASSMRFGQLINKIMNTVPPPNTPRGDFGASFSKYYQPMRVTMEQNEKLARTPQGYQAPTYEQYYPGQQ